MSGDRHGPSHGPPHGPHGGPHGPMTCREMADYLSDYVDGELDDSIRRLIDAHGGDCPPCRAFVRTLARTVEALRAQPREPLPPALKKSLELALREARRAGS